MNTTPSEIITESLRQRTCNLPNVEGKLNSKCNDTPSLSNVDSLNKFIDVYKSIVENKISIAKKYLALVVQMHSDNQTFQQ